MEELLAQYVIPLDARTKKNHQQICGRGPRCPHCGKHAKQFIRSAKSTTDFAFRAVQYLRPRPNKPIPGPVHLVYLVYTETWRKVDDLNLYANLDDILVENGILEDDNRKIIRNRDGSRVLYDHERPRVEIYIYSSEEAVDGG